MNSYGLIDLHCDTLAEYWKYAHTGNPDTLDARPRAVAVQYAEGCPLGAVLRRVHPR